MYYIVVCMIKYGGNVRKEGGYDKSNIVYTPRDLSKKIIDYFQPEGLCLDPCKGDGAFYDYLPNPKEWCEVTEGRDFYDWEGEVDWIITNPPWSGLTPFLKHCFEVSKNTVLLYNLVWTKKRIREMIEMNQGQKEIIFVDSPPPPWPQMGIQLVIHHYQRGWKGDCKMTYHPFKVVD